MCPISVPIRRPFHVGATNYLAITSEYAELRRIKHIHSPRVHSRLHGDNQIQRGILVWNPNKPHKYTQLHYLMARDTT